jgi:cytochrome c553
MKKKLLALSISLALVGAPGILQAKGKVNAGAEKAAACAGCHGEKGNSLMPMFPKLAQQHASYLIKQLVAFKDGTRAGPTMAPMAAGLSVQDMEDIAAFYAVQKVSVNELPVLDDDEDDEASEQENGAETLEDILAKGGDLYRNGDQARQVSACIACHGPEGEGNKPAAFPALKGQHADYLIKSLNDYKSGVRVKNQDNMMLMIAKKMSDEEIKAVAYYISMMK